MFVLFALLLLALLMPDKSLPVLHRLQPGAMLYPPLSTHTAIRDEKCYRERSSYINTSTTIYFSLVSRPKHGLLSSEPGTKHGQLPNFNNPSTKHDPRLLALYQLRDIISFWASEIMLFSETCADAGSAAAEMASFVDLFTSTLNFSSSSPSPKRKRPDRRDSSSPLSATTAVPHVIPSVEAGGASPAPSRRRRGDGYDDGADTDSTFDDTFTDAGASTTPTTMAGTPAHSPSSGDNDDGDDGEDGDNNDGSANSWFGGSHANDPMGRLWTKAEIGEALWENMENIPLSAARFETWKPASIRFGEPKRDPLAPVGAIPELGLWTFSLDMMPGYYSPHPLNCHCCGIRTQQPVLPFPKYRRTWSKPSPKGAHNEIRFGDTWGRCLSTDDSDKMDADVPWLSLGNVVEHADDEGGGRQRQSRWQHASTVEI